MIGHDRPLRRDRLAIRRGSPSSPLRIVELLLLLVPLTACDSFDDLLTVDLPGQVVDTDLDNAGLAETLVLSAQGDFECAFQGHLWVIDGAWAQTYHYHDFFIELIRLGTRQDRAEEVGQGECTDTRDPIWFPMHVARTQAAGAIRRIKEEMPEDSVQDRDLLLGKAYAYEGYATQLLAEAFCGVIFGGNGEIVSRKEAMRRAEGRFTSALEHANRALSGPRAEEAREIVNMALVGRARVRLNLGNEQGVLDDAGLVQEGFVRYATYDESPERRNGPVSQLEEDFILHESFRELEVDGVPDPRVPSEMIGRHHSGFDWWVQRKYANDGTDIPFATWREAQLMIAEVEGGQKAVEIINDLRATVGSMPYVPDGEYNLPEFRSSDDQEIRAQVLEERRRELFLQGTKIGNDLRTGQWENWDTGLNPMGQPYGDNSCMPVPDLEFL